MNIIIIIIIQDLLDECSKEIEEGTPKCGTNPPTPFATAFVSFVHEDDREECEQSFHNSGKLDFVSFMGCGKPVRPIVFFPQFLLIILYMTEYSTKFL